MQLHTVVFGQRSSTVLRLVGRLNRHAKPALDEAVPLTLPDGQRLVVDLDRVIECDRSGAAALLGLWQRYRQRSLRMCVAAPTAPVRAWLALDAFDGLAVYTCALAADRADPDQRLDPMSGPMVSHRIRRIPPQCTPGPRNTGAAVHARPDGWPAVRRGSGKG